MRFLRWVLALAVVGAGLLFYSVRHPFGPGTETFVEIPAGTGSVGIAARLAGAGVIQSPLAFAIYRKYRGGTLRAGEYRFDHAASLPEVYGRILKGDVYTRTVTLPEGFNLFDVAHAVEAAGLGTAADFLAAAEKDTDLIAAYSPHAQTLEGFLYPDTYRFSRHATPRQMLQAMVARFRAEAVKLGLQGDVERTVTLASLIEKEVHFDDERALVAGVFENRLRAGMPLATDPAVIYAALRAGRWRGTIYQSDLQSDSPYNTYRHLGLPPGPIASPGEAALKAALRPAATDYLYFVADASGKTQFSVDLAQHARQVAAYRAAGGR